MKHFLALELSSEEVWGAFSVITKHRMNLRFSNVKCTSSPEKPPWRTWTVRRWDDEDKLLCLLLPPSVAQQPRLWSVMQIWHNCAILFNNHSVLIYITPVCTFYNIFNVAWNIFPRWLRVEARLGRPPHLPHQVDLLREGAAELLRAGPLPFLLQPDPRSKIQALSPVIIHTGCFFFFGFSQGAVNELY